MTPAQRDTFQQRGLLLVPGAIAQSQCASIKQAVLAELDRAQLRVNGKPVASKLQHLPIFQQSGMLAQKVRIGSKLETLFSGQLLSLMNQLAGSALRPAHPHPQLLLSFPHKEPWTLEGLNWHLDLAVPKQDQVSGVQAFAVLDDLQPRGGATLALTGSHRLPYVAGNAAGSALALLRGQTLRPSQSVHGIDIEVVEMTGRAGDVYLMDLRVLHSPSVNAGKSIRMMATNRFTRVS